ncbi:MAG: ABC transporter substrate-binding protein, partial [Hyphomicrobiales bacterium]
LDAAMTGGAGQSGEAIKRGLVIALEEINAAGGVLGRPLELVVRDNHGMPDRGVDNIEALSQLDDLVAVVGGIHTPVAMAELKTIHRNELLYLAPWAAGTLLVDNGHDPNFVFRLSVRDEYAGGYLIKAAMQRGFKRPGLLLWRTSWGRSNETAMKTAMTRMGMEPAGVQWFNTSERDLSDQIDELVLAGADVIMLVASPTDGRTAVKEMARRTQEHRLPIISHWGITGADFVAMAGGAVDKVDLTFLQTYSFFEPPFPEKSERFYQTYCARFGPCESKADVISPVGTAHAYDLLHLLKLAIDKAGSIDRGAVRAAMEQLGRHEGLVRVYDTPFTAARHDALDESDFRLCRYGPDGAIIPVSIAGN